MQSFDSLQISPESLAQIKADLPMISDNALELFANINLIGQYMADKAPQMPTIHANYIENMEDATDEAMKIYINDQPIMEANIKGWTPEDISATNLATHLIMTALNQYKAKLELA